MVVTIRNSKTTHSTVIWRKSRAIAVCVHMAGALWRQSETPEGKQGMGRRTLVLWETRTRRLQRFDAEVLAVCLQCSKTRHRKVQLRRKPPRCCSLVPLLLRFKTQPVQFMWGLELTISHYLTPVLSVKYLAGTFPLNAFFISPLLMKISWSSRRLRHRAKPFFFFGWKKGLFFFTPPFFFFFFWAIFFSCLFPTGKRA